MRDITPLCSLAKQYSTDKGGRHFTYNHQPAEICHEYTPFYYDLFRRTRESVYNVLEIGINKGCSLRMWAQFFPLARVVGVDIDENYLIQDDRITSVQGDASDPVSLTSALMRAGACYYDVIIDDGSHLLEHQLAALPVLLGCLSYGGTCIVEDAENDPMQVKRLAETMGYKSWIVIGPGPRDALVFIQHE